MSIFTAVKSRVDGEVKDVYTGMMRTLFILVLLSLASVCYAEQTIGEIVAEKLKTFIMPEENYDSNIKEAMRNTQIGIGAAQEGEWEYSQKYMNDAFLSLIRAVSYAETLEERTQVNTYLDEHRSIDERLVCSFHAQEAKRQLSMSKMAVEHFENYENALHHANWGTYYIEEAVKRCAFDPERVELLEGVQVEAYHMVEILEDQLRLQEQLE